MLGWAKSPYAIGALFLVAFVESSIFPVPPDVLLSALCLASPNRSFFFATVCTIGSVIGGMLGYLIGWGFWQWAGPFLLSHVFPPSLFERVSEIYRQHQFWAVFTAGFTPIPYKVFTIAGGVCHIHFGNFVVASILSRGARFFLVGACFRWFGPTVKVWLEKYLDWIAIGFVTLLGLGFVLLKYVH